MIEVKTDLPVLNVPLLSDLIMWAEMDQLALEERALAQKTAESRGLTGFWNQGSWGELDPEVAKARGKKEGYLPANVCGTAYCMAGGAALVAGYRFIYDDDQLFGAGLEYDQSATYCVKMEPTGTLDKKGRALFRDAPGAPHEYISSVGEKVLGLSSDEADHFFSGSNDISDLKEYANYFCEARGMPVLYPDHDSWSYEDE